MANVLYKVPLSEWVLGTIQKMNELRSTDVRDWTKVWYEVYQELGGKTPNSGNKGCPRVAAFGLWYLGLVKGGGRPRL